MQGNVAATVTIALGADQITEAFIINAYERYDSDPRVHGPEDLDAFRDALLGATGSVLEERQADGWAEKHPEPEPSVAEMLQRLRGRWEPQPDGALHFHLTIAAGTSTDLVMANALARFLADKRADE